MSTNQTWCRKYEDNRPLLEVLSAAQDFVIDTLAGRFGDHDVPGRLIERATALDRALHTFDPEIDLGDKE